MMTQHLQTSQIKCFILKDTDMPHYCAISQIVQRDAPLKIPRQLVASSSAAVLF